MVSRRHGLVVICIASAVVLAAGFSYLRGGSTPVSVGAALQQFRKDAATAPTIQQEAVRPAAQKAPHVQAIETTSATPVNHGTVPAPGERPLPAAGVYVYATSGFDHVDVLGGSTHQYPAQTTITVRHARCGFTERWDVLRERWDERESCRTARGDELRRLTSYHEFFRHGDLRTFACSGFTYPAGNRPGASWTVRCSTSTTMTVTRLTAVAWEDIVVGGRRVRTLHVHGSSRLTGEQQGTSERDVWGSSAGGIVIQEHARIDSDSTQPVFGKTHYHEQYEIRLTSLTPQR